MGAFTTIIGAFLPASVLLLACAVVYLLIREVPRSWSLLRSSRRLRLRHESHPLRERSASNAPKVLVVLLGRVVGAVGAALTIALMAWWGYDLAHYLFFSENPTWAEVGVEPFVVILRIIVAAWVICSVIRLDARALLFVLLLAFGSSFVLLYGWYYLLTGMDWGFLYWVVGGDFLYLVAWLLVRRAVFLPESNGQPGNS